MQVLYIVLNLRTRPTHLITYWVNMRAILNPTLINRVNKLMTNIIRYTYNCFTFLESSGQFDQTIYRVNVWGYFDSIPKGLILCILTPHPNRVNKLITHNIKSTYNCHTFLESSGQVHLTIHRVNIWGYIDSVPKYRVNLVYFDPTSKKGQETYFQ